MDVYPHGYTVEAGDVVIRHSDKAPSLYLVGAVTAKGELPQHRTQLFASIKDATAFAKGLVAPDQKILFIRDDQTWYQVT
jgi:hypothetical protein